jgi:hypothetical protein
MNSWQTRLLHQFKLAQQGINKLQTKRVHAGIVSVRGNFNCLTSLQKMKVQVIKFQGKRFCEVLTESNCLEKPQSVKFFLPGKLLNNSFTTFFLLSTSINGKTFILELPNSINR